MERTAEFSAPAPATGGELPPGTARRRKKKCVLRTGNENLTLQSYLDSSLLEARVLRKSDLQSVTVYVRSTGSEKCPWLHRRPTRGRKLKLRPEHRKEPSKREGKECVYRNNCTYKSPAAGECGVFKKVKEVHCSEVQRLGLQISKLRCPLLDRPGLEVRPSYPWFGHPYGGTL